MNLGCLISLLTSPSLAVAACPCVCGYSWVVCSSVCICCVLRSVPPSVCASVVSVPVPGSSAPLSVSAIDFAVAACSCVYGCPWVVRSSVCVCCVPGSVFLSTFASAVSVLIPDLSVLPSMSAVCACA